MDITPDSVINTFRTVDTIEVNTSGVSTLAEFVLPRGTMPVEQTAGDDANPIPRI